MGDSKNCVLVSVNGETRTAFVGDKLSSVLSIDMPCGSHGKCGKCKVKAWGKLSAPCDTETKHLTNEELKNGIRLACTTVIEGNCSVETLNNDISQKKILTDGVMSEFPLNPVFSDYGVAIDIGTTTLAASLYNSSGEIIAQCSSLNPQSAYGADVVSRIESALKGEADYLAEIISKELNQLILSLADTADISAEKIDGAVITGNTVMLYLLTKTSTEPLSHAPFNAPELFGKVYSANNLCINSLSANTTVYLPSCISAFVGADTVCALLSTGFIDSNKTELLADIGTNGEIALMHNGELTVTSTAAGPAFEGVGISMGMRGESGAIDRVSYENGEFKAHIIGECEPKGICGSGLIDSVACLLESEILDETGYLEEDTAIIADPVYLTDKDIRMVQLAKSAIHAGINTLIKSFEISHEDIDVLHIAGGFGSYLNMKNAGRIGLIPNNLTKKVKVDGNAALSGAAMMLLNRDFRNMSELIASKANVLELSSNPIFADEYMEQMMF